MTLRYILDVQPGLTTVLAETTGAITTRYIHGPTGIHAQQNADGGWRWLLQDGLQSVRAVANGTDVVAAQQYSPYGVPVSAMTETDFGFTGELTDDNDLVYLRARYLNPGMGVFTRQDPIAGNTFSPLTLNRYGWVKGNPANLRDPFGYSPVSSCRAPSQSVTSAIVQAITTLTLNAEPQTTYAAHTTAWMGRRPPKLSCPMVDLIGVGVCEDAGGGKVDLSTTSGITVPSGSGGGGSWANVKAALTGLLAAAITLSTADISEQPINPETGEPLVNPEATPASRTGNPEGDVAAGPYAHLKDSRSVGPGKDFTDRQKAKIKAANRARPENHGKLVDDLTGEILVESKANKDGAPPENQAEVDHIYPVSRGGTNSYANAQIISRETNRKKDINWPWPPASDSEGTNSEELDSFYIYTWRG